MLRLVLGILCLFVSECLVTCRAVYYPADIFLLDDILSAVDAQVAQCILDNAIHGPLLNQRTRVLCTHNQQVSYYTVLLWIIYCVSTLRTS